MGKIIGIDFGTTNSRAAVVKNGIPVLIPNDKGKNSTPSVIRIRENGERIVGEEAENTAAAEGEHTAFSVKRKLGSKDGIRIGGALYMPQQAAAMILRKLKLDAERYLGEEVTEAVITVPACFDEIQRQAVRDAGRIAGFKVRKLIHDTSAAALYYTVKKEPLSQKILMADIGGGSFSVSVIEVEDGVVEVLSSAGSSRLGGEDFDRRIAEYIADVYKKKEGKDLFADRAGRIGAALAAEKVKKDLSAAPTARIKIPRSEDTEISVDLLEALTKDLTVKIKEAAAEACREAGISPLRLDKIFLMGGASKIPSVRAAITAVTGKEPDEMPDADLWAAFGAAIQGGKLEGKFPHLLLLDALPYSFMIETAEGILTPIMEKNATIPLKKTVIFTTSADNQTTVDISVYQGESKQKEENRFLGTYRADGIEKAPKGVPRIEVGLEVDANGILNLTSKNISDGRQRKFSVSFLLGLSEDEIRKAAKEEAGQKAGYCKTCGHPLSNEKNAKFCMYCGAEINPPDKGSSAGREIRDDGISFQEGTCPVCGKSIADTESLCSNCGFPVISITGNCGSDEIEKIKALVREYRARMDKH